MGRMNKPRDRGTKERREERPGVVRNKGHGPSGPVEVLYGVNHLRRVLDVSADVNIQRLCEDAAVELEELRKEPTAPWPT